MGSYKLWRVEANEMASFFGGIDQYITVVSITPSVWNTIGATGTLLSDGSILHHSVLTYNVLLHYQ